MDDILLDDPRRASAKKAMEAQKQERLKPKRTFGQYLFDLIVNTMACFALLAIDFTLFANSGNYNIFGASSILNQEVIFIYATVFLISFILTFLLSFSKNLQNSLLAIIAALFVVAIINQFATFEKHSALLMLFGRFLSENTNNIIYEYSFEIIGASVFLIVLLLITLLKRVYRLYLVLAMFAVLAWIVSEAYFNTSQTYFKTTASSPSLRAQNSGKTLLFLSFNNMTSPNNLRKLAGEGGKNIEMSKTFNNMLGMLSQNGFVLYPNAMLPVVEHPFYNLVKLYNPADDKDPSEFVQNVALEEDYFDFTSLQYDKMRMKESSLYEMLRKKNYNINVYQTRELDTCYVNNKLAVVSCKNKINYPFALSSNNFNLVDKTLLLTTQWLNSTGFVNSLNLPLKFLSYVLPVKPLSVKPNEIYSVNAFRVFDQIADDMDRKKGNQAYFAVIDLPSDSFVYDEFCQFKKVEDWVGEKGEAFADTSLANKQKAYANQLNCVIGSLEYFLRRLDKSGQIGATTIVLTGLDNPQELLPKEIEYYPKLQSERQILLAIKPEENYKFSVDYSVCKADEILSSHFFSGKCDEFADLETTDKNLKKIKEEINLQKYDASLVERAKNNFNEWFKSWVANNQNGNNFDYQAINSINDRNIDTTQPKSQIVVEDIADVETLISAEKEINLENVAERQENIAAMQETISAVEIDETVSQTSDETNTEVSKPMENTNALTNSDDMVTSDVSSTDEAIADTKTEEIINQALDEPVENEQPEVVESIEDKGETQTDETATEKAEIVEDIKATEVIPETLFDDVPETEMPQKSSNIDDAKIDEFEKKEMPAEIVPIVPNKKAEVVPTKEDIINKAKQALENKQKAGQKKRDDARKKVKYLSDNIEELAKNEEFRQVLEAPVAQGSNMTPQELKKQYHKNLIEAADKAKNEMNIEVKVIENK